MSKRKKIMISAAVLVVVALAAAGLFIIFTEEAHTEYLTVHTHR